MRAKLADRLAEALLFVAGWFGGAQRPPMYAQQVRPQGALFFLWLRLTATCSYLYLLLVLVRVFQRSLVRVFQRGKICSEGAS